MRFIASVFSPSGVATVFETPAESASALRDSLTAKGWDVLAVVSTIDARAQKAQGFKTLTPQFSVR